MNSEGGDGAGSSSNTDFMKNMYGFMEKMTELHLQQLQAMQQLCEQNQSQQKPFEPSPQAVVNNGVDLEKFMKQCPSTFKGELRRLLTKLLGPKLI